MTTTPGSDATPPAAPQPAPQPTPPAVDVSKDDKNMAMLSHLLGIFFGFIPALVIWLLKKEQSQFIDDQAKEALNWQITMAIASVVAGILVYAFVGCILLPAIWIANLIFCIKGAMAASNGVRYRYPWALRLVK